MLDSLEASTLAVSILLGYLKNLQQLPSSQLTEDASALDDDYERVTAIYF